MKNDESQPVTLKRQELRGFSSVVRNIFGTKFCYYAPTVIFPLDLLLINTVMRLPSFFL